MRLLDSSCPLTGIRLKPTTDECNRLREHSRQSNSSSTSPNPQLQHSTQGPSPFRPARPGVAMFWRPHQERHRKGLRNGADRSQQTTWNAGPGQGPKQVSQRAEHRAEPEPSPSRAFVSAQRLSLERFLADPSPLPPSPRGRHAIRSDLVSDLRASPSSAQEPCRRCRRCR